MSDKFNFTPEQEAAIKHRGGALLVSAAAGAGKTKVLVGRLLDLIGDGADVDEFLVITYTRAAAAELRGRIYEEILDRIAENPGNRRLRRQSILCRGAAIGTIHSYCAEILRENAHLAGLPPDFRVMDESESELIKTALLEDVLNEAYETIGTSDSFRALIDAVATGRDDKRLAAMVMDAYKKLQSDPAPESWLEKWQAESSVQGARDVSQTIWGGHLVSKTRERAGYWRGIAAGLLEMMKDYPDFNAAYGPSLEVSVTDCDAFLRAFDKGWDEARRFSEIRFARPKPIKGYDELKAVRLKCKAELDKCAAIFACSSDEHLEDMRAVAPAVTALMQLILDFDSAYSREKRNRSVVDFSDLEHLTLSLLVDEETGEKTEFAHSASLRFKEIMIDEYQDINAVQEAIFQALSQDGKNIFMVGDVKQSIYRFRLADPAIFLEKYNMALREENSGTGIREPESVSRSPEYASREPGVASREPGSDFRKPESASRDLASVSRAVMSAKPPELVLLSKNFRSRAGILNFVNNIFESTMSAEFGEMDYTERERLIPGRENDPETESAVEVDLIDMKRLEIDDDEESPEKTQIEARYIADRILELTDGSYVIPDGRGGARRVAYSDIVILLRSVRGKAWQYAAALSERGIPPDMPGGEGYFETIEVTAALSLLSLIDNPMQDIPLAAALRGPAYGFTPDELADIRAGSKDTDFYSALVKAAWSSERCSSFLNDLNAMRELAPDMSASGLIWHMYNKTGLLGSVGAMRGGAARRENLILLVEYARLFEQNGYKGLFSFLTYISGMRERGEDPARNETSVVGDAVRIMSIHKSKGLEFPIVFIADTTKRFNFTDIYNPLVLHPAFGIGIKRIDRQRRITYPTIARMAIQSRLTSEMLAEELRVLYVAMTRAREKLIVTATLNDAEKARDGAALPPAPQQGAGTGNRRPVPPQILEDMKSAAEWILAALPQDADVIRIIPAQLVGQGTKSGIQSVDQNPESETREFDASAGEGESGGGVELLRDRFSFVYPYEWAPELPSKLTVTEVKGRQNPENDGDGEAETAVFATPREFRERRKIYKKPVFAAKNTGLTAAERGTALHLAMQYIRFGNCGSIGEVENELRELVERGILTAEQEAVVDAQKIARFFETGIGKRALMAEEINREFKFSLLYPAGRFYPGGGDDQILLQGIVDCFFEEDGELVIIDFKTDQATRETLAEKISDYTPQLAAYSDALERITGKNVQERVIYFFSMDEEARIILP